jgi:hypothetical protein
VFHRRALSRLHKVALAAVLGLAVMAPAPAVAAPGDAIIDPNSPAGTEYDLPLDRARDETSGSVGRRGSGSRGSGSRGSGSASGLLAGGGGNAGAAGSTAGGRAPLFGVGIAAAGESVDRGSGADARGGSGDGSEGKGSPRSGDGSPLAQAGEAAKRAQEAAALPGSRSDTKAARTWLAALAAAILAAGGLVGLLVRRASRRTGEPSYLR